MTALTGEELIAWVDRTSELWLALLQEHPEALAIECDVMDTGTVARLLQHIVAVELRYAQRLAEQAESSYDQVGCASAAEIFETHNRAMDMLRNLLTRGSFDWEARISFATRSAGTIAASRRTVLVHMLMHSIRHYAQLATLMRQHGIKPNWPMDYLFMGAIRERDL